MASFSSRKTLTAAVAALSLAAALTVTSAGEVEARPRRGGAIAAGVIGGLAAGALIGGLASGPAYGYQAPAYGYGAPAYGVVGGYDSPAYGYESCRIVIRERVNRFGELVQVRRKICD